MCTGSLILAQCGLLHQQKATTHWIALPEFAALGAIPVRERFVRSTDKILTATGVSAGIDMSLALVALLAGETRAKVIQLSLEYDPQLSFHAGSPEKAGPEIVSEYWRT